MFEFTAKLLKKKADAWDGIDSKIYLQDNHYSAKTVWNKIRQQFGTILTQYKIKNRALKDWVDHYGMAALDPKSPDPAVRKAAIDIRNYLKEFASTQNKGGSFRDNEIKAFQAEYGANVSDWIQALVGGKQSSLLVRRGAAEGPRTLFHETH